MNRFVIGNPLPKVNCKPLPKVPKLKSMADAPKLLLTPVIPMGATSDLNGVKSMVEVNSELAKILERLLAGFSVLSPTSNASIFLKSAPFCAIFAIRAEPNGNILIVGEAGPASAEEKVHDAAIWEVTKDGDVISAKYYGFPNDSDFATSLLQLADNQYAFFGITRSVFTDSAGDRQWGGWYFPFEVK